jgi:hypothetical protein
MLSGKALCGRTTENAGVHEMKTQKTKAGEDIPIPKRGDFFSNLKKAATPEKSERGPKKK